MIGAGPIGQMSVRWGAAAGATTIAVADIAPERLASALPGGATLLLPGPLENARETLLAENQNVLPGVVVDTTGNAAIFAAALGWSPTTAGLSSSEIPASPLCRP